MDSKKVTKIGQTMYEVVSRDEYFQNRDFYDPNYTALQYDGYIYPIRTSYGILDNVGVLPSNTVDLINTSGITEEYSSDNIIDMGNNRNMQDVLDKAEAVKSIENELVLTTDNVYKASYDDADSPALVALKMATEKKNCNPDLYAYRFGANYNNDIRHLKKNNKKKKISLDKLVTIADNLDMKVTLSIEDKSPNVPNPMGEKVTVILNGMEEGE